VQPEFLQIASDEPDVSDIELFRADLARVGDTTMPILTSERVRGDITPVLLSGRLPVGDEEIAIGGVAAHKLQLGIGDTIEVSTNAASAALEVVGLVVAPGLRGYDVLGENSYVHVEAYDVLFPGSEPQVAALRIRPGGNVDAARDHIAGLIGVTTEETQLTPPSSIINLRRVTFVPYALSALLLALGAIALVGALWSSVRRRQQQIAVLRALGADRAWLRVAAVWHAVAFTVVPALIGGVIGLIAGRLAFRSFAHGKGVVDEVATPWTLGLGSILLLVVLAVVATTAAGHRARNVEPALLLRAA
jgi:putative ABC transport system permease protein